MRNRYDVIVIGGGAAGLSGALMLGRSRRTVLVIDAGEPRNAPADGVHGFLSRDGMNPLELLEVGHDEVRRYGVDVANGRAHAAARTDRGFAVTLDDGSVVQRRLLVTTGLIDELPEIAGLRERWGREVVHCPYCHGWEIRDQAIGVLATGGRLVHRALLFRQLTDDLTVFLHTEPEPTGDELEQLASRDITIVRGEIDALEISDDQLIGIRLRSGDVVARDALAVARPRFVARAEVLESLGLVATEHPLGVGSYIESDATGATSVPGVWVAGNVADVMAQVVGAAAAGSMAGAAINADLIART